MINKLRNDEERFIEDLSAHLIGRLSGDYIEKDVVMRRPSREFIIGCLSAKFGEESYRRTIARTNSLAVSFLTTDFSGCDIVVGGSVFHKLKGKKKDTEDPTWRRKRITLESIRVKGSFKNNLPFDKCVEEIRADPEAMPSSLPWKLDLEVRISPYEQKGEKYDLVTIYLVNNTPGDEMRKVSQGYDPSIFTVKLEVSPSGPIIPFEFNYEYEGFKESYSPYVKTLNCGADYDPRKNTVVTTFEKTFDQPLILPKNEMVSLDGKKTTALPFNELTNPARTRVILGTIQKTMEEYLAHYRANQANHGDKFKHLTAQFEASLVRFKRGIKELDKPEVMRAFNLMQETFRRKDESQAIPFKNWRLFQLVYIVSLLPDVVDVNSNAGETSVLHVDTGGGKSEAYFGLVVFSAFLDRLTEKEFGPTAITKFPLRMLSIQQLQRIAAVFAWAEEVRKDGGLNGAEFSVGYLVGESSDFPNHNFAVYANVKEASEKGKRVPGKILDDCPICGEKTSVSLRPEESCRIILHKCEACDREFRIHFSDDEIYRSLPTFIVSTVDKMAAVGGQRKFKQLVGGELELCPEHGFMPRNDKCKYKVSRKVQCKSTGKRVDTQFSVAPRIVIQDEMHLIREAFGTIDSHFETFIEELAFCFTGNRFKNIAMTATTCGAHDQIKNLYDKETSVFPGESPEGKGNIDFFFSRDPEHSHRKIIGLTPNMRDNQYASLLTLRIIVEHISYIENDAAGYAARMGIDPANLEKVLENYKAYLTYHNKVSDVHGMSNFLEDVVNSKLRERGYSIRGKSLTGALSLEEIKDEINYINSLDTRNTKDIPVSFATSLVSHGVDIDKWNVMVFQGFPRSTAEYIQALSRIGRQHAGLVIDWFYPSRVRDQSFFQNFNEYHEILAHHVERVPIERWAKLGFHQTFNTLFCGAVLNYISNTLGRPIYTLSQYRETLKEPDHLDELIAFLKKAYRVNIASPGSDYFRKEIERGVEKRHAYLMNYSGKGNEVFFFPNCLKDSDERYFKMQYGMRGIQDTVLLGALDGENSFVLSLRERTSAGGDDDE